MNRSLLEAFSWRYAVKRFDPAREIPETEWRDLESTLVLSPSAYGLQPWRFLAIRDRGLRRSLRSASWNQAQVEDCSHLLVFTARATIDEGDIDELVRRTAEVRGVAETSLSAFREMVASDLLHGPKSAYAPEWAARQTYLALGCLLSAAAAASIDACPLEGIDPAAYDAILRVGDRYRTLAACALGYRAPDDPYARAPKVRYARERVVEKR